jgi:hypothetical protein
LSGALHDRAWLEQGEQRRRARAPSVLEPFRAYIERRFADDPPLDATVLLWELRPDGFVRSYQTLTRAAPARAAAGVPGLQT